MDSDSLVSQAAAHDSRALGDPGRLLTTREAAAYLRVSKSYLDKLRVYGGGPTFHRLAARKIVYRRSALDAWAAERRFRSTAEYS